MVHTLSAWHEHENVYLTVSQKRILNVSVAALIMIRTNCQMLKSPRLSLDAPKSKRCSLKLHKHSCKPIPNTTLLLLMFVCAQLQCVVFDTLQKIQRRRCRNCGNCLSCLAGFTHYGRYIRMQTYTSGEK